MADQQRYSEEEVHSILREALRLPSANSESGFSKEDIQRFAAEAGISDQALEQSLSKHRGRRRAHLIEHQRKTALTLDWELSDKEVDAIAELCEVHPPYAYKLNGNFATIRIDRIGFYCIVSVLRKGGYTQIELDRGWMMEVLVGISSLIHTLTCGAIYASVERSSTWVANFVFVVGLVSIILVTVFGGKNSKRRRGLLAKDIVEESGARLVK